MYRFKLFVVLASSLLCFACSAQSIPQIIFDTDMGPDYDDVGALAVLHALAASGECEILATIASDRHPSVPPTIEVLNRYFQKPDLPIGMAGSHAPDYVAGNDWNDSLIQRYLPEPDETGNYPSAVEVYRKLLSTAEDKSVTIVTVGFTSNLAELLNSEPDDYSSLAGTELIRKKVKEYVAMAGVFPSGKEFNVMKDSVSSFEVFRHWPTPIMFSGFEVGVKIKTGRKTAESQVAGSPVQWAYEYNLRTYGPKEDNRSSWDQTAVLIAVRNPEKYFYVNGPGKFIINRDGTNSWDPDIDAGHYFISHKYPYHKIEETLEELMMHIP